MQEPATDRQLEPGVELVCCEWSASEQDSAASAADAGLTGPDVQVLF
jgi:hypothetical protein